MFSMDFFSSIDWSTNFLYTWRGQTTNLFYSTLFILLYYTDKLSFLDYQSGYFRTSLLPLWNEVYTIRSQNSARTLRTCLVRRSRNSLTPQLKETAIKVNYCSVKHYHSHPHPFNGVTKHLSTHYRSISQPDNQSTKQELKWHVWSNTLTCRWLSQRRLIYCEHKLIRLIIELFSKHHNDAVTLLLRPSRAIPYLLTSQPGAKYIIYVSPSFSGLACSRGRPF